MFLFTTRYCEGTGLSAPTSKCDPGWYCELGSWLAQPDEPQGSFCVAGEYCPLGSSAPTACDPGSYCHRAMMNETGGLCAPGYYCSGNSTTSKLVANSGLDTGLVKLNLTFLYV